MLFLQLRPFNCARKVIRERQFNRKIAKDMNSPRKRQADKQQTYEEC